MLLYELTVSCVRTPSVSTPGIPFADGKTMGKLLSLCDLGLNLSECECDKPD